VTEKISFLDVVIAVLREHEASLSDLVDRLEKALKDLHMTQLNEFEAFRKTERIDFLIKAILYIDSKGLTEEFKDYVRRTEK